jgi:hypothetical protein
MFFSPLKVFFWKQWSFNCLINYWLTFSERYFSHSQDENKFNNIYKKKYGELNKDGKWKYFVEATKRILFFEIYKSNVALSKHVTHFDPLPDFP